MRKSAIFFVLAIILAASMVLIGCSNSPSTNTTAPVTSLGQTGANSVAPQGELVYAVPSLGSEDFGWTGTIDFGPQEIVYETLTRTNINGAEPEAAYPWLAKSWTHSDDYLTYDFYLNQGIQWQKGYGELTADDVVYTYNTLIKNPDLKNLYNYMFSPPDQGGYISSIEEIDKYHIRFNMSRPYTMLALDMTDEPQAPFCKKYVEQVGWDKAVKEPIGTSPWQWVETVHGDHIKFQAVDNDWMGRKPEFKYLTCKLVPDLSTELMMLESGQADMMILNPGQVGEAKQKGLTIFPVPNEKFVSIEFGGQLLSTRATYDPTVPWAMHTDEPENSDWNQRAQKVREALCLSIDAKAIIAKIMYGYAREDVMRDINMDWPGYLPAWQPYPYDPVKAKQLLAEAGYANGFAKPIQCLIPSVPNAGIDTKAIMMTVADDYEAIGLKVDRQITDQNLIDQAYRFSWDSAWKSTTAVGFSIIEPMWGMGWSRASFSPMHETGENPTFDKLISEWQSNTDPARGLQLTQELGNYQYINYTEKGLFDATLLYCFGPKVKGVSKMPYFQEAYMIPFFDYENIQRAK